MGKGQPSFYNSKLYYIFKHSLFYTFFDDTIPFYTLKAFLFLLLSDPMYRSFHLHSSFPKDEGPGHILNPEAVAPFPGLVYSYKDYRGYNVRDYKNPILYHYQY